jgi:ElaB/YqjD/DUF883 family membrane-anchored ribosome-binding protein
MVNCPKCGKNNVDDAAYCSTCGTSLKPDIASHIEHHAKMFAENMEQMGKNLEKSISQTAKRVQGNSRDIGKRMEHRVDHASKYVENWYDRTFGVVGPLVASFLFLIIVRLAIEFTQISVVDVPDLRAIASVILLYLLPLFGATLLSNYTTYFAKKSYKFRIFSPLFHSIAFVIILWIIAQILYDLQDRLQMDYLGTAAINIENILPAVFVFVLLIGYVVLALNMPREPMQKP